MAKFLKIRYACPHCSNPGITLGARLRSARLFPAKCTFCARHSFVRIHPVANALLSIVMAIGTLPLLFFAFTNIRKFIFLLVAGTLLFVIVNVAFAELVPLQPKKGSEEPNQ